MARGADGGRTQIIIATIGFAGVIAAALIANWDKIFPKTAPPEAAVAANQAEPAAGPAPGAVPVDSVERMSAAQAKAMNANADAMEDIARKIEAANTNNQ